MKRIIAKHLSLTIFTFVDLLNFNVTASIIVLHTGFRHKVNKMNDKSASTKWLFSEQTEAHFLPDSPKLVRASYMTEDELRHLAREMAEGKPVELPDYVAFDFNKRLSENARIILYAFRSTDAASRIGENITPAAQWLLDNHYTIDKTVQQTRRDFPKSFLRQLPPYEPHGTLPRIFALAWLYVAHTDSDFSLPLLTAMVEGYQEVKAFQIGELWALPSAVRMILIENARRLSLRIERARRMRHFANQAADKIMQTTDAAARNALFASYEKSISDATFSTHLFYRLRGASVDCTDAIAWLENALKKFGSDPELAAQEEHSKQATGGVVMGNIIRALKAIDDVDWTTWFESVSHVDFMLRDKTDLAQIDFQSRNAYRVVIEKIARRSKFSELDVTQKAIALMHDAQVKGKSERECSVGWYLVDKGRLQLEKECAYNVPLSTHLSRAYRSTKIWSIAVPVSILTILILAVVFALLLYASGSYKLALLFIALAFFPTMDMAFSLFNTFVSWWVPPSRLVGYEYKEGIPEDARTLVVVPTMITSLDVIDEQVRNLEVHYLSNPNGALNFALATDWADSRVEQTTDDFELFDYAQKGIAELNRHYRGDGEPLFFLFHRRRLYNEGEKCWMGWERKRGKLHELNLLLRGDQDTSFFPPDPRLPQNIRFVMTLDSDTRLTTDAVNKLVGKLSHPLNRPVLDKNTHTVTRGYGILQPRVTPSLTTGEEASFLQRVFSVNRGIDPYVFAVSDTYQDLLHEGTFTGKGLYDLDAFEAALEGRVKENGVLSHDLLEGGYARCALVSDVEVVEDYPTAYNVDAARNHRWVRGDWQLLPYLFTRRNINLITRWKMQDNLRRSLTPLFWILASIAGWCLLPLHVAFVWQVFLVVGMFISPTLGLLRNIMPVTMDNSLRGHFRSVLTSVVSNTADVALRTSFVAYTAYYMMDAIIRTLYRLFISKQHLLEWKTSAATKSSPDTLRYYFMTMWPASLIGIIAIALPAFLVTPSVLIAIPFGLCWFFSPFIAWVVSRPAINQDALKIHSSDKGFLRRIARRTWVYYETFTTAENNFLPPDNFQEDPAPKVAQRTSPTNIGVYLLSVVAARDFGWISFIDTVARIQQTIETVEKMEKFRGHLYNWYQTDNLSPLMPLYVSTVDSGNFAGHLVTLSSALNEWAQAPSVYLQGHLEGLLDVNDVLEESLHDVPDDRKILRPLRQRIEERIANFHRAVRTVMDEPESATFRTINLQLVATDIARFTQELDDEIKSRETRRVVEWAERLIEACEAHTQDATSEHDSEELRSTLLDLARRARQLAFDMKFDFLERPERRLLSIGFRVQENELDESCYDLLASEARLSSLFAIAKGDVKVEHWFRLGRLLIPVGWKGALLSWSGSMFEYLMPPLVMREPLGSMLDQTNRLIVRRQITYARERHLPWGISEAAFNARDQQMNYQYSNFGVPSLGLQRGLSRNAVIAPYASLLAAQYMPAEAVANLKLLQNFGALGDYGFHDSIDFTPSRVREGETCAVIKNYYAHHHGMSILAVNNVIFEGRMRNRFHSDPVIEAAELLLQEKAPREIPMVHAKTANPMRNDSGGFEDAPLRVIATPLEKPRASLIMSDGEYSVMLTANGSGYSTWKKFQITRFSPDATEDQQGTFFFLRDLATGRWWSATGEPTRVEEEESVTVFSDDKAEFHKSVDGIKSNVECIIANDAHGEGRHIELINTTGNDRIIEVTSFCELVLNDADADQAHPVFSRMFVETEIADNGATIFAQRRKRAPNDPNIHVTHFVTDVSGAVREAQAETSRRIFLGQGRSMRRPAAFDRDTHFTGSQGCVMDPIASIRCRVRIPAHKKTELIFWTFAGESKEELQETIGRYREPDAFRREYSMAWTRAQVGLYQIGISPKEALTYQTLATPLIYPDRTWRLPPEAITERLGKQSLLWPMSISGDFPIVLLRIDNDADIYVLRELLRAHEYWSSRGLVVDLVVLNERAFSYAQDTQRAIEWICEGYRNRVAEASGRQHIFTVRGDQLNKESADTLLASARIVLHAQNGSLAEQLKRVQEMENEVALSRNASVGRDTKRRVRKEEVADEFHSTAIGLIGKDSSTGQHADGEDLQFWNGYGGFDKDGSYVVRLSNFSVTPHPWINVITNENFGMHVSAEGASFTWAGNSRDYQLTPWANDPVCNRPGEALYIVDRVSKWRFSPYAAVERDDSVVYETRHGFGYSTFSSECHGLKLELTHTVDVELPLRFSKLIIKNETNRTRSLKLYNYVEWVLGNVRAKNAPFIIPHYDEKRGALFAANPYHSYKSNEVSFIAASQMPSSYTADRNEFIGATGTVKHPVAIRKAENLSNMAEAGCDPCSALAYDVDVKPGESTELIFILGHAENQSAAEVLLDNAQKAIFDEVLKAQRTRWSDFTAPFQVKTKDKSFDLLVNHWLPYQSYACRIMARAAFYQASGAFGFRDQLQDTLSMLLLKPELAHEQILNAASRQFPEGDVQHWWLPATGAGVRTLISDDVAWLAYGTALYCTTTGHDSILDTELSFIEGEPLKEGQHDSFFTPAVSPTKVSLYEHCALALDLAVARTGTNGIPLMLGGDWNDGMNLVGIEGKGESVWLGWFLGNALNAFIPFAEKRGDKKRLTKWKAHVESLKAALDKDGWDGAWYRRGFFDNGTPLGSATSDECQIDTIAQSWAVLSNMAPKKRARKAMQSMLDHLMDKEGGLVRLFWPPFDKTQEEPGYIKGYPPGVRENGGQYTHGAIWSILALAALGENDKAYEVFSMINPIHHGAKPETYRVEPYVIAADIYSVEERRGRGGWTWYTGSSGWFYRAAVEGILGFRRKGDRLFIAPALPSDWDGYEANYIFEKANYHIVVKRGATPGMTLNKKAVVDAENGIVLKPEGNHNVVITLSSKAIKG